MQAAKAKRKVIFKRAESYVKEYTAKEREEVRLKRAARAAGDFYVPAEPKVYFVIRIRGINEIAPKPRKSSSACSRSTTEPYATYGEPNLKSVRELAASARWTSTTRRSRRSWASTTSCRSRTSCVGPNFKQAANLLRPFKLSNPNGGWRQRKFKHDLEGGDRESNINKLIRQMN